LTANHAIGRAARKRYVGTNHTQHSPHVAEAHNDAGMF